MKVNMTNAEDFIAKCVEYAASLDLDSMDDHTEYLVGDLYRLAELALEQHKRLEYVREQLTAIENIPGVTV